MKPSKYILDPPDSFGPIEELVAWRERLRELDQDDAGVQEELADVEDVLSWRPEYDREMAEKRAAAGHQAA
jgi:hypothetical protein